jgi:LmbE family N-acetylglucosaminyl deacetylase
MLIAAHPDDESIACSIVLQQAVRAGAAVRVIYATDGENNPWPQRVMECKWHLDAADRERWGKLRRAEAIAALDVLGVSASDASFLALPDQKLTALLRSGGGRALKRLAAIITNWTPTDLLVPSISDTHPDHSALAVMLRLVFGAYFSGKGAMSVWSYVVHGRSPAFLDRAESIRQTAIETATKLHAISCHKTQLKLSRKRFLNHAARPERLLKLSRWETAGADGAISSISRQAHSLSIILERSLKPMRPRKPALFILGHDEAGMLRCARMRVPLRSSRVEIFNQFNDEQLAAGHYCGDAYVGELVFPIDAFSANHALFVKLERRGWFFDEAGWLELPAAVDPETVAAEAFAAEQPWVPAEKIDNVMALQQTSNQVRNPASSGKICVT